MANVLQKIAAAVVPAKNNLPALSTQRPVALRPEERRPSLVEGLPNATVIYGIAASIFTVMALFSLLTGHWVSALIVLMVAACMLGYAIYYLKNG